MQIVHVFGLFTNRNFQRLQTDLEESMNKIVKEKLYEILIQKELEKGLIKKEDVSVYRYGYTLMLEMFINVALAIIIGAIMHEITLVFIFLVVFIPLRSYAGGYHADKAWQCVILSNIAIIVAIYLSNFLSGIIQTVPAILADILLGTVIVKLSPVQSINKKLSYLEINHCKKAAFLIVIIQIILEALFMWSGNENMASVILAGHSIVVISLMAGRSIMNKPVRTGYTEQ